MWEWDHLSKLPARSVGVIFFGRCKSLHHTTPTGICCAGTWVCLDWRRLFDTFFWLLNGLVIEFKAVWMSLFAPAVTWSEQTITWGILVETERMTRKEGDQPNEVRIHGHVSYLATLENFCHEGQTRGADGDCFNNRWSINSQHKMIILVLGKVASFCLPVKYCSVYHMKEWSVICWWILDIENKW